MIQALMVTQAVLFLAVLLLAIVLMATLRQVGVLFERVAPLGALTLPHTVGPGERSEPLTVHTLAAKQMVLGGVREDRRGQLLLFVSPSCPMCKQVLSWARSFAHAERHRVELVLVGEGSPESHQAMVSEHHLGDLPLVLEPSIGLRYRVGKLPYAILTDSTGLVRSAGLINSREHLESLVLALESGVVSVQEYLSRRAGASAELAGELVRQSSGSAQ